MKFGARCSRCGKSTTAGSMEVAICKSCAEEAMAFHHQYERVRVCYKCDRPYNEDDKSACAAGMCQGQDPPRLLLSEREQRELQALLGRMTIYR